MTNDNFTTVFSGQTLTGSFIDSGSNGLFFPNGIESNFPGDNIPLCPAPNQSFDCPAPIDRTLATNGSAINQQFRQFQRGQRHIQDPELHLSNLAGPTPNASGPGSSTNPNACSFDWGLSFFYGRHVYTAIDGATPPTGATGRRHSSHISAVPRALFGIGFTG